MRYKLLGRTGLRVSELCLGTMTFGPDWGWGADRDESRAMFDAFAEAGGNFIDTANRYTNGTAESYVGEFIAKERERFVVATKYTLTRDGTDPNAAGNHRKSLVESLDVSLRRLKTDYIDVYWAHIWDPHTPIEEMMRALDDQVRAGKIHAAGWGALEEPKLAIARQVAAVAGEIGCSASQVALRWVQQQSPNLIPVIGSRQASQLVDNLGCVDVTLSPEQLDRLDQLSRIELGFPYDFIKGGRTSWMGDVVEQVDDHRGTVV